MPRIHYQNLVRTGAFLPFMFLALLTPALPQSARTIRVAAASAQANAASVPVELIAQGNENAIGFSLKFDPTKMNSPVATLGSGAAGASLNTNSNQASQGYLGIALALPAGQVFTAGTRQLVVVTFAVVPGATGSSTLDFADQPIAREVSDATANPLTTTYTGGTISFGGQQTPALYLNNSRFKVQVNWSTPNGSSGYGTGVSLTSDSGYFWFFVSSNVELLVKILDGRTVNGYFWVFYGSMTDVQYTITITDTTNGRVKTFLGQQGVQKSGNDTAAFP